MIKLKDVLSGIDFRAERDISGVSVAGVTPDSKSVKPQDLFIAVKGHKFDGHDFIGDAVRKGAKAVIAEKNFTTDRVDLAKILVKSTKEILPIVASNFYGHPADRLKIIGITGTNGKTTITYLMEKILDAAGHGAGVIGTINYRIGDKVVESRNTTPGAAELQAILKEMTGSKLDYAVMEVSSHSLDQNRIGGIMLDSACFTNITKEHLDYHKTINNYMRAKSKIFKFLKKGGTAVLNADDVKVSNLRRSIKGRVITYGIKRKARVMAKEISTSLAGSSFTVRGLKGEFKIRTRLMGLHNVSNILAAVSIGEALGIGDRYIKRGVESLKVVPGRLEAVEGFKAPFSVFIDYAHTDDALYNVLKLLSAVAKRDIITVFGCGGDRDRFKRPRMGKTACELSSKVVITSDNPRSERPIAIIREILEGVEGKYSNYFVEEDRAKAIRRAIKMAGAGDIVLIAGKGHEKYQIIGDKAIPFDDKEVAERYLDESI